MLFDKNMNALKKHDFGIWEKLNACKDNSYTAVNSSHESKVPNLLCKATNQFCYDNNNPLHHVNQDVKNRKISVPNFTIFLGLGLGYHIFEMLRKVGNQDYLFVVVEKDPAVLKEAFRAIDFTMLLEDKNILFFVDENLVTLRSILQPRVTDSSIKLFSKALNFIEIPSLFKINNDYYMSAVRSMKEVVRNAIINFGNDPDDSLIGIENTFLNINEIIQSPGILELKDKFKGKPGIVVASGPSLNKNIEILKKYIDNAVIAAADGSLKILKKHSIKPHLVTSLERVIATSHLFEGLTREDVEDIYFAACPVIRPETYHNFPGERIIVYRNFATFKWLEMEKGTFDVGPSAGNMAFNELAYLGCNPIILMGQDLAYGETGMSHADGYHYGSDHWAVPEGAIRVRGNYSEFVYTSEAWHLFLHSYEKDVAHFPGTVINATEGGALINGTEVMTFLEAANKHLHDSIPVAQVLKENLLYPSESEIKENRKKVIRKYNDAFEYCQNVKEKLKEGFDACVTFEKNVIIPFQKGEHDDEKTFKYFSEVEKNMSVFSEKMFFEILMHYVQSFVIRTMVEINGIKAADENYKIKNIKVVMMMKELYQVTYHLVDKFIQRLRILDEKLK